ncbi:DUF1302 family protein, partial [Paraburkholderia sp. SIMBA_050]
MRLVISISMQFEAGGQPPKGADSPFPPVEFPPSVPADLASATWFAYGYREGIPRLLDLWVSKQFNVGDQITRIRVGNHAVSWGESIWEVGGPNATNALDAHLASQPAAQVKE